MQEEWFWPRKWKLAHKKSIEIGPKAIIMGILNVTPDSFSDGGEHNHIESAIKRAHEMVEQGVSIIDIGGESTKPDASPVDESTEQSRVLPVIEALTTEIDVLVSIDTYRASTAEQAIKAGAHIVNDIWALQADPRMAEVVDVSKAGLVAMHNSRDRDVLTDPIKDQKHFASETNKAMEWNIIDEIRCIWDPGIGFGKDEKTNLKLLNRLDELHYFDGPKFGHCGLLVGTSRKRFLGAITGREAANRGVATAATSVVARMKGAAIFRVHDIEENRDALAIADALIASSFGWTRDE